MTTGDITRHSYTVQSISRRTTLVRPAINNSLPSLSTRAYLLQGIWNGRIEPQSPSTHIGDLKAHHDVLFSPKEEEIHEYANKSMTSHLPIL